MPIPEDIIQAVKEMSTITNKIQLDHFDCDQHIAQQNYFSTIQNDNQENYVSIKDYEHESDGHLDDTQ